jgi:RNA polymerase sigma-70 factor (ECF subfamily)
VQDADSEELVQELMLYLWEERESVFIESSLKAYLFTAVKHRCLNAIRKRVCRERVYEAFCERLKDRFESPDYYLLSELSANIEKAIRELPEKYRQTFELSRFGELSNAEIAARQNVSVKTVEYRITQSLKILREKLKDYLLLIFCF